MSAGVATEGRAANPPRGLCGAHLSGGTERPVGRGARPAASYL